MDYPIRFADQLKPHLKSLRKKSGWTQAELGLRLGVKQARVAEIEASPGVVGIEQMIQVLAALGMDLVLSERDVGLAPAPEARAATISAKKSSTATSQRAVDARRTGRVAAGQPASASDLGVRPKKGAW